MNSQQKNGRKFGDVKIGKMLDSRYWIRSSVAVTRLVTYCVVCTAAKKTKNWAGVKLKAKTRNGKAALT
jgi:hypothetical protein